MLVLTRKKGESIIIDGYIEVKIMEIGEGKVSIGIDAPRNVDILRKELYESIQEENVKAAKQHIDLNEVKDLIKKTK